MNCPKKDIVMNVTSVVYIVRFMGNLKTLPIVNKLVSFPVFLLNISHSTLPLIPEGLSGIYSLKCPYF